MNLSAMLDDLLIYLRIVLMGEQQHGTCLPYLIHGSTVRLEAEGGLHRRVSTAFLRLLTTIVAFQRARHYWWI